MAELAEDAKDSSTGQARAKRARRPPAWMQNPQLELQMQVSALPETTNIGGCPRQLGEGSTRLPTSGTSGYSHHKQIDQHGRDGGSLALCYRSKQDNAEHDWQQQHVLFEQHGSQMQQHDHTARKRANLSWQRAPGMLSAPPPPPPAAAASIQHHQQLQSQGQLQPQQQKRVHFKEAPEQIKLQLYEQGVQKADMQHQREPLATPASPKAVAAAVAATSPAVGARSRPDTQQPSWLNLLSCNVEDHGRCLAVTLMLAEHVYAGRLQLISPYQPDATLATAAAVTADAVAAAGAAAAAEATAAADAAAAAVLQQAAWQQQEQQQARPQQQQQWHPQPLQQQQQEQAGDEGVVLDDHDTAALLELASHRHGVCAFCKHAFAHQYQQLLQQQVLPQIPLSLQHHVQQQGLEITVAESVERLHQHVGGQQLEADTKQRQLAAETAATDAMQEHPTVLQGCLDPLQQEPGADDDAKPQLTATEQEQQPHHVPSPAHAATPAQQQQHADSSLQRPQLPTPQPAADNMINSPTELQLVHQQQKHEQAQLDSAAVQQQQNNQSQLQEQQEHAAELQQQQQLMLQSLGPPVAVDMWGKCTVTLHTECAAWCMQHGSIAPPTAGAREHAATMQQITLSLCQASPQLVLSSWGRLCPVCHQPGANINCTAGSTTGGCSKAVHLLCARQTGWLLQAETRACWCPEHKHQALQSQQQQQQPPEQTAMQPPTAPGYLSWLMSARQLLHHQQYPAAAGNEQGTGAGAAAEAAKIIAAVFASPRWPQQRGGLQPSPSFAAALVLQQMSSGNAINTAATAAQHYKRHGYHHHKHYHSSRSGGPSVLPQGLSSSTTGWPAPGGVTALPPGQQSGEPVPGHQSGGTVPGQQSGGTMPGQQSGGTVPGQQSGETVPGQQSGGTLPGQRSDAAVPGQQSAVLPSTATHLDILQMAGTSMQLHGSSSPFLEVQHQHELQLPVRVVSRATARKAGTGAASSAAAVVPLPTTQQQLS